MMLMQIRIASYKLTKAVQARSAAIATETIASVRKAGT